MAVTPPTRLSAEIEFYKTRKAEWVKSHDGEFVVVKGSEVLGFFANFHDGYYAGVENMASTQISWSNTSCHRNRCS